MKGRGWKRKEGLAPLLNALRKDTYYYVSHVTKELYNNRYRPIKIRDTMAIAFIKYTLWREEYYV